MTSRGCPYDDHGVKDSFQGIVDSLGRLVVTDVSTMTVLAWCQHALRVVRSDGFMTDTGDRALNGAVECCAAGGVSRSMSRRT